MKKQKKSYFKYILCCLSMQFSSAPIHTFFMIIVILLEAIGLTARTIVNENLFDVIIEASEGKVLFTQCLLPIAIMALVTLGQQAINGFKFWYWPVIGDKIAGINKSRLFKKIQKIDPENFEKQEFLDDLNKAKQGIWPLSAVALNVINVICFDGVYALTLGYYLFSMCPILIVTLIVAFVPALVAQNVRLKLFAKLEEESAPIRRENDYYYKAVCDKEYFKETRVLGAFNYFSNLFEKTLSLLIHKQWKTEKKTAIIDAGLNMLSFVGMGVSVLLLFFTTMQGEISIAAFAAIFTSIKTIFDVMDSMMRWDITNISNDIGKVINYIDILDYAENEGCEGSKSGNKYVRASNVMFKYPTSKMYAVDNISLELKEGETIAIVGENGSGKSTLVKLLTGIYKPCEGSITIDDLDTKKYKIDSVRQGISGVFQNFQRYKFNLLDNISISEPGIIDGKECKVNRTINEIGFDINGSIDLNTVLSPEFGGVDLSGGQWQSVAIARGIYRECDFIVLDEPTAAIDPIEEDRIFSQFKNIVNGKNAIIVTHRLGSVRMVDKIVVLDKGKIVDVGTHDDLISRNGKYAELWKSQAEWYDRE